MSSPDEIRADIVATRAELTETVDVIAQKVTSGARKGGRIAAGVGAAIVVIVVANRIRQRVQGSRTAEHARGGRA